MYFYKQIGSCRDFASGCGEVNDQYLGSTTAGVSGYYSMTGLPTSSIVYVVFDYRITDPTNTSKYLRVVQTQGGSITALSLSKYLTGNISWDINLSCPTDSDGLCTSTDANSATNLQFHQAANILATAGLVDQYAGGLWNMNSYFGIWIYFPDGPNNECTSPNTLLGRSWDASRICLLNGGVAFNNQVVAHELGHTIHKRLLNVNGVLTSGGACSTGYNWTSSETEKCATVEGWANFVALATHWTQAGSSATYAAANQNVEGYTTAGNGTNSLKCVSNSSNPHTTIGNVTRFFWDLYDSTVTGDDFNDSLNDSLWGVRFWWDDYYFTAGTGNRQASESGSNGRNIYDYLFHAGYASSYENAIRTQNCLDNQAP